MLETAAYAHSLIVCLFARLCLSNVKMARPMGAKCRMVTHA